jgi:hypothetical protein
MADIKLVPHRLDGMYYQRSQMRLYVREGQEGLFVDYHFEPHPPGGPDLKFTAHLSTDECTASWGDTINVVKAASQDGQARTWQRAVRKFRKRGGPGFDNLVMLVSGFAVAAVGCGYACHHLLH